MKRISKRKRNLIVTITAVAALLSGPALLPYVPTITLILETMTGQ